ncbi:MAG TPA: tetratricopeptide repeat protein [Bacilli bacterium]|nr:tetratricopeptide repeat protein [Bacilli bacterium]
MSISLVLLFCFFAHSKDFNRQSIDNHESQLGQSISSEKRSSADMFNSQGFACLKSQNYLEAAIFFSKALELKPNFAKANNNLGVTCMRLKQYDRAEYYFRNALNIDQKYAKAAFNLSVALLKQKKYFDAYESYKRARNIDSEYVNIRLDKSKVEEAVQEIIKQEPDKKDLILVLKKNYENN